MLKKIWRKGKWKVRELYTYLQGGRGIGQNIAWRCGDSIGLRYRLLIMSSYRGPQVSSREWGEDQDWQPAAPARCEQPGGAAGGWSSWDTTHTQGLLTQVGTSALLNETLPVPICRLSFTPKPLVTFIVGQQRWLWNCNSYENKIIVCFKVAWSAKLNAHGLVVPVAELNSFKIYFNQYLLCIHIRNRNYCSDPDSVFLLLNARITLYCINKNANE